MDNEAKQLLEESAAANSLMPLYLYKNSKMVQALEAIVRAQTVEECHTIACDVLKMVLLAWEPPA